ncbi:MAG: GNAT family N-acetyltransferase [Clostridia bacterium]|nr:GNAT family N-acetyltransferase [Clostridia bacterium]
MIDTQIDRLILRMPTLETERLVLRRLTKKDARDVYEYSSDPNVPKYLTWSVHESYAYTKKYLRFLVSKYKSGEYLDWGIVLKSSGKLIGTCGFTSIDTSHAKGEIGYVLNPSYWNCGYATEAVERVLEYAFNELELNRVEARVMEGNTASVSILNKCNMTHEGTFTQELFVKGEFKNVMHFAICRKDYPKK